MAIAITDVSNNVGSGGEGFLLVRQQLEALNPESGILRRSMEDLHTEIGSDRAASMAAGGEARKASPLLPQLHHAFLAKLDHRGKERSEACVG